MTLRQVATILGVSHALVSQWENDEAKPQDLRFVAQVMAEIGLTTADSIIGDEPVPPPPLSREERLAIAMSKLPQRNPRADTKPADIRTSGSLVAA